MKSVKVEVYVQPLKSDKNLMKFDTKNFVCRLLAHYWIATWWLIHAFIGLKPDTILTLLK